MESRLKHRHITLLDAQPDAGPGSRDAFPTAQALTHPLQPQ